MSYGYPHGAPPPANGHAPSDVTDYTVIDYMVRVRSHYTGASWERSELKIIDKVILDYRAKIARTSGAA